MEGRWLKDVLDSIGTPTCRPRLLFDVWQLSREVEVFFDGLDPEVADGMKEEMRSVHGLLERVEHQLEALAKEVGSSKAELERERESWNVQSRVISALAAEVPDEVRARVLAPLQAADGQHRVGA